MMAEPPGGTTDAQGLLQKHGVLKKKNLLILSVTHRVFTENAWSMLFYFSGISSVVYCIFTN